MMTRRNFLLAGGAAGLLAVTGLARAETPVRIATLASGTVAWELDTIVRNGFDRKHGISISIVPVAGKLSADVMLKGGAADVIVTDFIWVSRQRHQGQDYTFLPYSRQVGSVLVSARSTIMTMDDLRGKKIGIAGGPTDKSWILIQAYTRKTHNFDIAKEATPIYGSPPLLNEQLQSGAIDALITFWHFAALLKANNAREIISLAKIADTLGLDGNTPLLGYVFSEDWSAQHNQAARKLAAASRDAKTLLLESDDEWQKLKPLMNGKTDQDFEALKAGFRAGIPNSDRIDIAGAERLFSVFSEFGGAELIGENMTLAKGTFAFN